ncbi:MAG: hypothetical protein ACHQVS_01075 [Candidatus Babeliales bacterium]
MVRYISLVVGISVMSMYGMEEKEALVFADGMVVKKTGNQSDPVELIEESEFDKQLSAGVSEQSQQLSSVPDRKEAIPSPTQTAKQIKQKVNATRGARVARNRVAVRNLYAHKDSSCIELIRSLFPCCRRKR